MVLQAVYNIVDSAFVSNMASGGEDALNALTLAFPLKRIFQCQKDDKLHLMHFFTCIEFLHLKKYNTSDC